MFSTLLKFENILNKIQINKIVKYETRRLILENLEMQNKSLNLNFFKLLIKEKYIDKKSKKIIRYKTKFIHRIINILIYS